MDYKVNRQIFRRSFHWVSIFLPIDYVHYTYNWLLVPVKQICLGTRTCVLYLLQNLYTFLQITPLNITIASKWKTSFWRVSKLNPSNFIDGFFDWWSRFQSMIAFSIDDRLLNRWFSKDRMEIKDRTENWIKSNYLED